MSSRLLGLMTRLGSSALRSSLKSFSPMDLLRFLLWAYYEVGSSLLLCGDEVGWSALHVATRSGASTDVLRALLKVRGPDALVARTECGGLTPLHVACDRPRPPRCSTTMGCCIGRGGLGGPTDMDEGERTALFLLSRHPDSASSVSSDGDTPLHVACRRGLSPLVIRCLLHADPGAAVRSNRLGWSPLLIAAGMWPGGGGDGRMILGDSYAVREEDDEFDDDQELDYAWTVIRMLLLAGTTGRGGAGPGYLWDDERSIVHSAIGLGLPIDVVRFALRTFPDQIHERRESDGRTPLAVAAVAPRPSEDRDELIAELICSYPEAATVPDRDGRLPLHLAVLAGEASWSGGVGRIFRASPGALAVRDPVTRLFPFMLASLDRSSQGSPRLGNVGEVCPPAPPGNAARRPYEPTFSVVERFLGNFSLVFGADGTNHDSWDVVIGDDCGKDRPTTRGSKGSRSVVGGPQGRAGDDEDLNRVSLVYSLLRHNPSLVCPQMVDVDM